MTANYARARRHLREVAAEEIRALLARRRMSHAELARRTGLKRSTISRRMTGETALDLDDLEAIAEVLGVEPVELLGLAEKAGGELTGSYVKVPERTPSTAVTSTNRPTDRPTDNRPSGGPRSGGRRPERVFRQPIAARLSGRLPMATTGQ